MLLINHDPREPVDAARAATGSPSWSIQRFERARFVEVEVLPESVARRRGLRFYWRVRARDRESEPDDASKE